MKSLLIANRGEIAVRIARAAIDLGIRAISVYPEDDAHSLHVAVADEAILIPGRGAAAYLDQNAIVEAAIRAGVDAVHPGYGFLSENADFARACGQAGLIFVGPQPSTLEKFGDKATARALAAQLGVPVLEGTGSPTTLEEARAFFETLGPGAAMAIKAVAGGGGRGMRIVASAEQIQSDYERCVSEAQRSFGNGDVYAERAIARARHVEIQIIGDGTGAVAHLWERECSLQRRHQKLVEMAPAPGLAPALRQALCDAAMRMAAHERYLGLGTFEFLIDADDYSAGGAYAFIEANPRLQVEHTITEAITGLDLVQLQLAVVSGSKLSDLGLADAPVPIRGHAIQLRINMENLDAKGNIRPSGGTLTAFDPPAGPHVRTDTFAYAGYRTSMSYDSLLAKLIVHSASDAFADVVARARRAAQEFRIEGLATNLGFLQNLLDRPEFEQGRIDTKFVERHIADLAAAVAERPVRHPSGADTL